MTRARRFAASLLVFGLWGCTEPPPEEPADVFVDPLDDGELGTGTSDDPYRSLQEAIDRSPDGARLVLRVGEHVAEASTYEDPTCGNCDDATYRNQDVVATVGFMVSGKSIHLVGDDRQDTVLVTGAGYGLLFEDAGQSSVAGLTITGGVRDPHPMATDAAVVVRYTELRVDGVDIRDNNDLYTGPEPDPVVGVMGITGREGARLVVQGSKILNSSWDGIALYRSDPEVADSQATAVVVDTTIGCTEDCVSPNGRGVGIGATWDSELLAVNNVVHDYWKGIGTFGTVRAELYNNVVRDQVGWGVIVSGESSMEAVNNVIADNGTTGLAAWNAGVSGHFTNNLVTGNGWSSDEWVGKRTGLWLNEPDFAMSHNDIWDNEVEDVCAGGWPNDPDQPCVAVDYEGQDGNLAVDPLFEDRTAWLLSDGSPLVDAGAPEILDQDGSRSDIGLHGGPQAGRSSAD